MNSVVVYASRHGNTRRVAEAIAEGLRAHGSVALYEADDAPTRMPPDTDLLIVGGPTEARTATEPIAHFFGQLKPASLDGVAAAAFDTRVTWPRVLSGSAGDSIKERLEKAGARIVVPVESFMVSTKPGLMDGELERAPKWAETVAQAAGNIQTTNGAAAVG